MIKVRLVEFLGRGGLVQYAFQLTRGLRENGLDAALVTAREHEFHDLARPGELVELFHTWDPRPTSSQPRRGLLGRLRHKGARAARLGREWLRLIRYLERERPDWVVFGEILMPPEVLCLLWLRWRGFRLGDVCHNVQPFDHDPASAQMRKGGAPRLAIYGAIYRAFHVVFVNSEWSRRQFLGLYRADPACLAAIPHGNEAMFQPQDGRTDIAGLRTRLAIPEGARVALFFGTLIKYKGIEDLIRAFPAVVERVPKAYLVIAGYPMLDVDQLRDEAVQLGIEGRVIIWPAYIPREEIPALFELAQVAVFPYRSIDQSGALQLAYTFGLPVVATAVGGLPEVVEPGGSGLVVPPANGPALAGAIAELLADPARAQRLGARGRELSQTRFSWREVGRLAGRWLGGGAERGSSGDAAHGIVAR